MVKEVIMGMSGWVINSKKAYKRGKSRFEMEKNTMGKFRPKTRVRQPLTDLLFQMKGLQTYDVASECYQLIDPDKQTY